MKDKTRKKLELSKETLRKLEARPMSDEELKLAAGGAQTNDGLCAKISLSCRGIC